MVNYGRVLFLSVFAALLISSCSSSSHDNPVPTNNVPSYIRQDADRLIADLRSQGYEVTQGYFHLYTQDDCSYSYQVMKSCYGNNPAAPYILFAIQSWPEEYLDPATKNAFGLMPPGYSGSFRLDPREAIVILGLMPPRAAYFGLQSYQFTHEGTFHEESDTYKWFKKNYPGMLDTFFTRVPNNPERIQLFASLSNSNNDVVVKRQSGAAFNVERFFIITPDRFMDKAVRKALSGITADNNIFTEPIPSTVKTGLDKHADDFLGVMRYAMPRYEGAVGTPADTWRKDLPLIVLRVRDISQSRRPEPYGPPVLDTRTANDEHWLQDDLNTLETEVSARWGQPCTENTCSNFFDLQQQPIDLVGPKCTEIGMNCLADTQDTSYQGTVNLSLDNGEIYAVVGTLGTETGNATYVGLSVNEYIMTKGVWNIDSDQLKGTALGYTNVPHADKFYVYYFARDCTGLEDLTGDNCLSITDSMIPVCIDPSSPDCDYLKLVQREYISNGSERGPESTLVLPPRLLRFTKNHQ